jgi:hypothetical protein
MDLLIFLVKNLQYKVIFHFLKKRKELKFRKNNKLIMIIKIKIRMIKHKNNRSKSKRFRETNKDNSQFKGQI